MFCDQHSRVHSANSYLEVERQLLSLVHNIEGEDVLPSASLYQLFYSWVRASFHNFVEILIWFCNDSFKATQNLIRRIEGSMWTCSTSISTSFSIRDESAPICNVIIILWREGSEDPHIKIDAAKAESFMVASVTEELARLSQFLLKNRSARIYCRQTGWPIGCMDLIKHIKLKQPNAKVMGELLGRHTRNTDYFF